MGSTGKCAEIWLQISDQIGFETVTPTLSVICRNWGIPRSGQKFMGWEHSSELLRRGIHVFGADAHQRGLPAPRPPRACWVDLISVRVRANLGWSRMLAVSALFLSCLFDSSAFWSGEQARSASMKCWRHHPGRGEQTNRWRASWRARVTVYENDCDMTLHRSGLRNIRPLHADSDHTIA